MADLRALREVLAAARARVSPTQFPALAPVLAQRDPRGRRRHDGLTQAHLDILLGRTGGTYERLERGVAVRPDLLEEVARILRLDEEQWQALHRFAFSAPPRHPLDRRPQNALPSIWQWTLDQMGVMAYVTDHEGTVLGHNAALRAAFPEGEVPGSLLRWALTSPPAREILLGWRTEWAPALAVQLRTALASYPDSTALRALRDEVVADRTAGPIYQATTAGTAVGLTPGYPRRIRHAVLGTGWATLCATNPADAPRARLVMLPFKEDTSEFIRQSRCSPRPADAA